MNGERKKGGGGRVTGNQGCAIIPPISSNKWTSLPFNRLSNSATRYVERVWGGGGEGE